MKKKFRTEMRNHSFFFFLLISLGTHFFLLGFFFISRGLMQNKRVITPASIRVDVVELPDLPRKKKLKSKREEISIKPKQHKKKVKKIKDQKKGNQIVKGVEKDDKSFDSKQMEIINIYLTEIISKIKRNWNLPKYLTDINLSAQIEVKINDQGELVYKKIISSSGNDFFDNQVLRAIENTAPYPLPHKSIKKMIRKGIVFSLFSQD